MLDSIWPISLCDCT